MSATISTLIATNEHGVEMRHATRTQATWPGYGCALGHAGYWVGTDRDHVYLGRTAADARYEWVETYGGRETDIPLTSTETRASHA